MIISVLVLKLLIIIVPLLISVAYFTLAERKIMGYVQRCYSINALDQSSRPLLKFFTKSSYETIFLLAPSFIFLLHFTTGGDLFSNPNVGVLFFFTLLILTIHGIFLAHWSNNFKSPSLVFFFVLLVNAVLCIHSFHFGEILLIQKEMPVFFPAYPLLLLLLPFQNDHTDH